MLSIWYKIFVIFGYLKKLTLPSIVGVNTQVNTSMLLGVISQWWVRQKYPRAFTKCEFEVFFTIQRSIKFSAFPRVSCRQLHCRWWYVTISFVWHISSLIVASISAALDGGTQVISFILNLAIFGAAGPAVPFPNWWGNDLKYSADRCMAPAS